MNRLQWRLTVLWHGSFFARQRLRRAIYRSLAPKGLH
jgi:hypothetical protein